MRERERESLAFRLSDAPLPFILPLPCARGTLRVIPARHVDSSKRQKHDSFLQSVADSPRQAVELVPSRANPLARLPCKQTLNRPLQNCLIAAWPCNHESRRRASNGTMLSPGPPLSILAGRLVGFCCEGESR
ncbi:hypothetical protein V8C26DRAFT_403836 [Trichoderma gracile]